MKIVLTGPSGAGKTTLAKYIAKHYNVEFIQGSASLTLNGEIRENLYEQFGYAPAGHKEVITMSNKVPEFGIAFQTLLLQSRIKKLMTRDNFVTDRGGLDNIVYFLLQCSHLTTDEVTQAHIQSALKLVKHIDLTIMIPVTDQSFTEDNGSRVPNISYQRMVSGVFMGVIADYCLDELSQNKAVILPVWDLNHRKREIDVAISRLGIKSSL